MAGYELSKTAEKRLEDIYRHSVITFGLQTARRYLNGMHKAFGLLGENPEIGTDQSWVAPGLSKAGS